MNGASAGFCNKGPNLERLSSTLSNTYILYNHYKKAGRREGGQLSSPLLYSLCSFIIAMNVKKKPLISMATVCNTAVTRLYGASLLSLKSQGEIDVPLSIYDASVERIYRFVGPGQS